MIFFISPQIVMGFHEKQDFFSWPKKNITITGTSQHCKLMYDLFYNFELGPKTIVCFITQKS